MKCSGHPAASYRANPLQSPGDAILFYKYQGAPLTDYIHYFDHGVDGFKIPASAAYNFDRPEVVCEIYGNFHQKMPNDSNMLYRAGMEVYARGHQLPAAPRHLVGPRQDADRAGDFVAQP